MKSELSGPNYENGAFYGFHAKWNKQGTRLMFILRYRKYRGGKHQEMPCDVITMDSDNTTPIRWIDIKNNEEKTLVRIRTKPEETDPQNVLRVDPHPTWDKNYEWVVFNACPNGNRQVFLADLRAIL